MARIKLWLITTVTLEKWIAKRKVLKNLNCKPTKKLTAGE